MSCSPPRGHAYNNQSLVTRWLPLPPSLGTGSGGNRPEVAPPGERCAPFSTLTAQQAHDSILTTTNAVMCVHTVSSLGTQERHSLPCGVGEGVLVRERLRRSCRWEGGRHHRRAASGWPLAHKVSTVQRGGCSLDQLLKGLRPRTRKGEGQGKEAERACADGRLL